MKMTEFPIFDFRSLISRIVKRKQRIANRKLEIGYVPVDANKQLPMARKTEAGLGLRATMLFVFSFALLFGLSAVCHAQLAAVPGPDGSVVLTWSGGGADNIYRDTSPLRGLESADLDDRLWEEGPAIPNGWVDGDPTDPLHPTTDGTEFYYAVLVGGTLYYAQAIADMTPPNVENIAALPSPFSPNDDGFEDFTEIFFTLTETTSVDLAVWKVFRIYSMIRKIKDGLASGVITLDLQREFASNSATLMGPVTLTETNTGWQIIDANPFTYEITPAGDDLSITGDAVFSISSVVEPIKTALDVPSVSADLIQEFANSGNTLTGIVGAVVIVAGSQWLVDADEDYVVTVSGADLEVESLLPVRTLLPEALFSFSAGDVPVDSEGDIIMGDDLRSALAGGGGIMISQNATLQVLTTASKWLVNDANRSYTIELSGLSLDVKLEVFPPADNFVQWDGKDNSDVVLPDGRYIYRFSRSGTTDVAGNALLESISGDVWILNSLFELKDISVTPTPFSPDGDKIRDTAVISYYITDYADYVAGNIFSVEDGKTRIIASIYTERLAYYWDLDDQTWVSYRVTDGIDPGLSSDNFYMQPVNMDDYYTFWTPVNFSLGWDGSGASSASTYIIRMEAVKSNGAKTVPKTHEIIVEVPTITPNDKTAPVVRFTFPADGSEYAAQLEYVRAYLDDGQGAGIDLANSSIHLLGATGELIPGQQSNNGASVITWRLHEALPTDGSGDGTHTIVVTTVDYAKNQSENLQFQFEYNTSINDNVSPYVDGLPIVLDEGGATIAEISEDGTTVIYEVKVSMEPIHSIKVTVSDNGSGIDLGASQMELVKIVGMSEIPIPGDMTFIPDDLQSGSLFLQLSSKLLVDGSADGVYKLIVRPADVAGNTDTIEYIFTFETVEDIEPPYVSVVSLENEGGDTIEESDEQILAASGDPLDPFHLGQITVPIAVIHAGVLDWAPSGGISSDLGESYIALEGPSGTVSGEVGYRGEGSVITGIIFTPSDGPLSEDGVYFATIVVTDLAGNVRLEAAVATFEYVSDSSVIDDTDPPLVSDVSVISSATDNAGPICLDKYPYVNDPTAVEVMLTDADSGIDIDLSFIRLIEPDVRRLFSVSSSEYEVYETYLNNESDDWDVSIDGVRTEFPVDSLSSDNDKIIILIEEEGRRWLINDVGMGQMYTVKKTFTTEGVPNGLDVYDRYVVNGELTASAGEQNTTLTLNWTVPLSINGWYTVDVFAVDNARRLLFTVDPEVATGDLVAELDYQYVSDELRAKFDTYYGVSDFLSDNVFITVIDRGCLWLVTEQGQMTLDTHTSGGCRWRRIDDQKTYIVERPVWRDGDEIKSKLDIYESNAMTVQIPDVLFFDDTPPEMSLDPFYNDEQLPASGLSQFNKIRAAMDEDGSGINYDTVGMVVKDPSDRSVPGSLALEEENLRAFWVSEEDQSVGTELYTVEAQAEDMAGNGVTAILTLEAILEGVGPLDPEVVSVIPEDGALFNETITEVSAVLKDNSGSGIDFEESTIDVDPPDGAPAWWEIKGGQDKDEATQSIIWRFRQSLATDGRSDGTYRVSVRAYDNDGRRSERFRSTFTFDTHPPTVVKVELGSRPWVAPNYLSIFELRSGGTNRPLNRLDVELEDTYADIDIINSDVTIIGPNGSLETVKSHNGINSVVLDFPTLANDGSDDGIYQVDISAVDSLGNANPFPAEPPYTYAFIYDTQPPQMVETVPAAGSVVLSTLDQIRVKMDDGDVGVGVDAITSAAAMFVYGPHGQLAGTRDTEGGDTAIFNLETPLSATDTSDDGVYTVTYRMVDVLGNQVDSEFTFEYRALAPRLVSVELASEDESLSLTGDDEEERQIFQKSVTHVEVVLEDRSGTGLNFDATTVIVGGPAVSGEDIVENDGVDTLTYTFAEPFANDGSDDGEYWVFIRAEDNAGDWGEYIRLFRYDTTAPEVLSTIPADGSIFSEPISGVSATLFDAMTEVDLFGSTISLSGPASIAAAQVNNGVDTIALQFFQLADNGTADGLYEISVDPTDKLENRPTEPYTFNFIYDTKSPEVVSTDPASGAIITTLLEQVVVVLDDGGANSTAGIDLDACSLELLGPDGLVAGQLTRTEPDTLTFVPDTQMAVDGTDDGSYTISIVTEDQIGNVSEAILIRFVYATRSPTVSFTVPADGALLGTPVSFVSASLVDNSGAGLDLVSSEVTLLGPDGAAMAGTHSSSEPNTVVFSLSNILATDQTADGLYTLDILAADNTGTSANYQTTFIYDRIPPTVISVLPADGSMMRVGLDSVSAQLADSGSGVALEASSIQLIGPTGSVAGAQVNDGVDTIKLEFESLPDDSSADGRYVISVAPVDRVGNTTLMPQTFSFIYDTAAPMVVQTVPEEGATITVALDRVIARLDDANGTGIDLGASEIHLFDPNGGEVQGVKTDDGIATVALTFPVLAVDGSDDGIYTITVVTQDVIGNTSTTSVTFDYKTVAPELVDVVVVSEDAELSLTTEDTQQFERSVIEIKVILKDRSGEGLNLDQSVVEVEGPGVSDLDTIQNNGEDTITYSFAMPLANDGSDDGMYVIDIRAFDNDGHQADYMMSFVFDNSPPEVVSTVPADGSVFSEPLSEVSATLVDILTAVDLFDSDIALSGPASITAEQVNNGVDTITLRFFELADDGTADGLYTISVDPGDILGSHPTEPYKFSFVYDTTPPEIASTEPASGEVVTIPMERVIVILTDGAADSSAGVDLDACSLELIGPDGEPVDGELLREGPDTLSFVLAATDDGPADGEYTISVMTQDSIGNAGGPILVSFTHVTRSPAVVSTVPANGAQFRDPISSVSATLVDNSDAGLDLENSSVTLIAPDGEIVPGTHSSSEPGTVLYTLDNALATDNTDDGIHTLDILVVDMTGDSVSYSATFVYDTIPPVVTSTSPADGDMTKEGIESVFVKLEDAGSGVSLVDSTVQLSGPSGTIAGTQMNDGADTIEYRPVSPLGDGNHTISVSPVDNVGNAPPEMQTFSFIFDTIAPVIAETQPADGSMVVVELDRISVQLDDADGSGVALAESVIQLMAPDGSQIIGVRDDSDDTMVLTFPALAIDGSDNGEYVATVSTQDQVGNISAEYSFGFTYLPTAPGVAAMTPSDGSFIGLPVKTVVVTLADRSGSGIDFGDSWIKLLSPDGEEVPGQMSNDGISSLSFNLQNPFSTDEADDGEYTVEINAVDNEGNAALMIKTFFYDTTPATVLRVYVGDAESGITLDSDTVIPSDFGIVDRVSATISDTGIGVSLSLSSLFVVSPSGEEVEGESQNDGVDTISLSFTPTVQIDGKYSVVVVPSDKFGQIPTQEKLFSFLVDTAVPKISASTPKIGDTVVNRKLEKIIVQLDDGEEGSGVNGEISVVEVSGPNGEVAGELEVQYDDSNANTCKLLYTLSARLAMDATADGEYVVKVWFADKAGNGNIAADGPGEPVVLYFTYDTVQPGGPVINNVGVFPRAFSPNGDGVYEDTTISYVLSKDANVKLLIYDTNRTLITALLDMDPRPAGMNSIVWDGVVNGNLLPDGTYLIKIDAVDDLGQTGAVESSSVVMDTRPPSVDRPLVSNNPFTPDDDGFADTAAISFVVNGSDPEDSVSVVIYDQALEKVASPPLDRVFTGDGEYSVVWDGKDSNGNFVEDGEYSFVITVQDVAGNLREISGTVAMDRGGPVIQLLNPDSPVLNTNQSSILLSGTAYDWGGVRAVSMVATFIPSGSTEPVGGSNWVRITSSGDGIDNDGDGNVDEEEFNDRDDDSDGRVDEDLVAEEGKMVYWIHRLEPQTNGEYSIKFRASDPIDHVSVHSETLKVIYDSAPPLHVSTVGESTSSEDTRDARVRNGDLVTITTTWDEPGYDVTVDFSRLDSTSEEPIAASDRHDGTYVVDSIVSADNTQSDGMKTIVITAEDAAGNRTVLNTFRMELRNDLPMVLSASSPDDRTSYANGATVRILLRCDAPDLEVSVDFSELDSKYAPEDVSVVNNGNNTYLIEYTIDVDNELVDRSNIPIPIVISDGLESTEYNEYSVSLDNATPFLKDVRVKQGDLWVSAKGSGNEFATNAAFANGETVELETVWDGPGYDMSADFSAVDSAYRRGAESVEEPAEEASIYVYGISYELSGANNRPDGKDLTVIISAVDLAGNESLYILRLDLDNTAPEILSVKTKDKDAIYKNGDTVTLEVQLDAGGYEVSADFSELDSTYSNRANEVQVTDDRGGKYTVKYGISKDNTLGASKVISNINITITVVDAVGNSSTDSSMTVELDNVPPKLELESPESDAQVYEARIEVKGRTEPDGVVTVRPKGVVNTTPDVPVGNDGSFSSPVTLNIGFNTVTVTAADVAGNMVTERLTILYKPLIRAAGGGAIYLPEKRDDGIKDNDTRVEVPAGATDRDFTIEIVQLESAQPAVDNPSIGLGVVAPLVAYKFTLKDESGEQELSIAFVKSIQLILQYQDLDTLDGPAAMFRWDGIRWNKVGGQEDRNRNTVSAKVNSLSIFGLFKVMDDVDFGLIGAFPNPFTPNDDGVNDMVSFYVDNPNNAETLIRIFDLRGALVRRLEDGLTSWDGLDDEGEPVEMGAYIYQVEVESQFKGGTIVLAK